MSPGLKMKSCVTRGQTPSLWMLVQFSDEPEEIVLTSNLNEDAKYKHWTPRATYKWMKAKTEEYLSDGVPNCLMGLLNRLVLSQRDSVTSILVELTYTGRVAKVSTLVTPELRLHYMYNWNWI